MESTDSSAGGGGSHHHQQMAAPPPPPPSSQQPQLPPGFRFHPTDEELVVHYLKRKAQSAPLPVAIIAEVDLYKFDPWELPAKAVFGEQEWYFFSPRDRKYPNGARPNRAATSGYWKATGTDKPVLTQGNQKVGVKKALVFYGGKPPRGIKTNWIMHEYRLADNKPSNRPPGYDHCHNKKGSLRLDDWVLCRIYKKSNTHRPMDQEREDSMEAEMMMLGSISMSSMGMGMGISSSLHNNLGHPHHHHHNDLSKPLALNYTSLLDTTTTTSHHNQQGGSIYDGGAVGTTLIDPALASTSTLAPLKRTLPALYYDQQGSLSLGKRHSMVQDHHDHDHDNNHHRNTGGGEEDMNGGERNEHDGNNNNNNNSSIAGLLNQQLPAQTPSTLHQQSLLGSLQPYPLPGGLNWYS